MAQTNQPTNSSNNTQIVFIFAGVAGVVEGQTSAYALVIPGRGIIQMTTNNHEKS